MDKVGRVAGEMTNQASGTNHATQSSVFGAQPLNFEVVDTTIRSSRASDGP